MVGFTAKNLHNSFVTSAFGKQDNSVKVKGVQPVAIDNKLNL